MSEQEHLAPADGGAPVPAPVAPEHDGRFATAVRRVDTSAGAFWRIFLRDAARWVVPEQVVDVSEVTPRRLVALLLRHPSLRAMGWLRFSTWVHARGVPYVPGWVQRRLLRLYGLEISPRANIGGGLYIAHPVGVVLVAEIIGEDVTVVSNVTFGMRGCGRFPAIGDRVYLGVGARVLGGVRVGDDAVVGANAVVTRDVPPGVTVVGMPARPVERREPDGGEAP